MNQSQQEFLKIIEKAQKILIVPCSTQTDEQLASAALVLGLRQSGKKAYLAETDKLPQLEGVNWDDLDTNKITGEDIIITINNTEEKLGEIRYEKLSEQNGAVRIVIGSKSEPISKKDINIEEGESKFDLVILTGAQDSKQLDRFKDKYFSVLIRSNVVSIGYLHSKEQLSSAHLLVPNSSCLAEAVLFVLTNLESLKEGISPKTAQVILSSFLASTENFQNHNINAHTFNHIAKLLELGANIESARIFKTTKIDELASKKTETEQDAIPEQIKSLLKKAKVNQQNFLRWITLEEQETQGLLPENDFLELTEQMAKMEPAMAHNLIIANLASGNPHPVIKGWLKSSSNMIISELTELLNGFVFNGVLTFPIRAQNIEDAEHKVLKLAEKIFTPLDKRTNYQNE